MINVIRVRHFVTIKFKPSITDPFEFRQSGCTKFSHIKFILIVLLGFNINFVLLSLSVLSDI